MVIWFCCYGDTITLMGRMAVLMDQKAVLLGQGGTVDIVLCNVNKNQLREINY